MRVESAIILSIFSLTALIILYAIIKNKFEENKNNKNCRAGIHEVFWRRKRIMVQPWKRKDFTGKKEYYYPNYVGYKIYKKISFCKYCGEIMSMEYEDFNDGYTSVTMGEEQKYEFDKNGFYEY